MKISAIFTSCRGLRHLLVVVFLAMIAMGCKAKECKTLVECCDASREIDGIGSSCGSLAEGVKDPGKCRTIIKTIHYVYEDREMEIPSVCRLD